MRVFTVGHSTRTFEELVAVLTTYGVYILADVRNFTSLSVTRNSTPMSSGGSC